MLRFALPVLLSASVIACDEDAGGTDTADTTTDTTTDTTGVPDTSTWDTTGVPDTSDTFDTVDTIDTTPQQEIIEEGQVVIANTTSHYETCSSREYSSLTFSIINNSSQMIRPTHVGVMISNGHLDRDFVGDFSISPGAKVDYECFGGYAGQMGGDTDRSIVTLQYTVNGAPESVESTGTHTSSQDFDNCDTAFPDVDSDCTVVVPE